MASLMPNGKQQFFNSSGAPLAGGKVYTYAAGGTAVNKATFTTAAAAVQNANPVILDARGEAVIFWSGSYNVVVKDANDVLIYSTDNYTPTADALAAPTGVSLIGGLIAVNTTLLVPSQYATIQAAMTYLSANRIVSGAIVTIQVADGTYNLTAGLNCNHPDGANIHLVGNVTTPASCVLSVAGSGFDCLVVSNGNTLGLLDGFKFYKTVKALAADNTTAILANNGATIICGSKIVVDNWYYGIAARNGSFILCDYASVDHSGDVGIWAFIGSTIQCRNAISNNAIDVANNLGFGIQAEYGSAIDCQGASATGCRIGGIASLSNSQVRALSATASTNTGSGFYARDGATIEAHGATANNNTRYGVETLADGHVYYSSITATGNTINNFCPRSYFDNGSLGARIVTDDGSLRIDNSGTGGTVFNTSQGAQFGMFSTAGDSHFEATQGVGNGRLQVVSSLTNAAAEVASKGAEVVRMRSNGVVAFQGFSAAGTEVNYLQANSSISGAAVKLLAAGADAVIDLSLLPKGAGSYVQLGAGYNATGDVACNGYISVKDNVGTIRKLMTTA